MMRLMLVLLTFILFSTSALAKKPPRVPESYDYYNSQERYRWYKDARKYIVKHGGLNCVPPAKLVIAKDGSFDAIDIPDYHGGNGIKTSPELCIASVKNKKFPLPANSPVDKFVLPIRPDGPLTPQELDTLIFVKPAEPPIQK